MLDRLDKLILLEDELDTARFLRFSEGVGDSDENLSLFELISDEELLSLEFESDEELAANLFLLLTFFLRLELFLPLVSIIFTLLFSSLALRSDPLVPQMIDSSLRARFFIFLSNFEAFYPLVSSDLSSRFLSLLGGLPRPFLPAGCNVFKARDSERPERRPYYLLRYSDLEI